MNIIQSFGLSRGPPGRHPGSPGNCTPKLACAAGWAYVGGQPVGHRPGACECMYNNNNDSSELGGSWSVACYNLIAEQTRAVVEHAP